MIVARRIRINGIVQGVGFRPFVYQTARLHGLVGDVANTSDGVLIHVEGGAGAVEAFARDLKERRPPLSRIVEMNVEETRPTGFDAFRIRESRGGEAKTTLISPDVAVCEDCLRELFDPADRRFGYPFINCTNCGPRYTIIDALPYDRPHTAMRSFPMCPACQAEYDDPGDRRFHAQPNACPDCGPRVWLSDREGREIPAADPIATAAERLRNGEILAVKGLGGFHLAVDAENETAVRCLRVRKRREEKPFALMSPDLSRIGSFADIGEEEQRLLVSPRRPIVLLRKKEGASIAPSVSPGNRYFGVMLPYAPLHHLLLSRGFTALVMTSGNLTDEPIAIDNADALLRLGEIADLFLVHDRDIYLRCDDAILRHAAGKDRFIRRSRGWVPTPVFLKDPLPPVLACGAELKNTVCLVRGRQAFLSQHIGDLENLSTDTFFRSTIAHLREILDITPEIVAHDLHPDYLSTRYAKEQTGIRRVAVQHHHAHVVGCMAEHGIDGPVIGLSFDGTGLGTDGTVWGGEVLLAEYGTFTRAAALAPVPLPGSAAAIREPWRMGVSYLLDAFGEDIPDLPFVRSLSPAHLSTVTAMVRRGINSPLTSSMGRLFDGVAALLGIRARAAFEGQAAMMLEMIADTAGEETYPFEWEPGDLRRILLSPLIRGIATDIRAGVRPEVVSGKFHRTLIRLFTGLCMEIRKETGLSRVVCSGGVFQNVLLLEGLTRSLAQAGFAVYTNEQAPANDGGIALGQAVAAAAIAAAATAAAS